MAKLPKQNPRGGPPARPRESRARQHRGVANTARPAPSARKTNYHHGDLKEALIAAGETVLADRGLQGFTLRECARRAGVSHAAPKHHFGDVRGLLTEIAARGFTRLTRRLRSKLRAAGADLDAQFLATSEAYLGFAEAYPEHFRIMFRSDLIDVFAPSVLAAAHETFAELTNVIHRQHREPAAALTDLGAMAPHVVNDILIGWCYVHGLAHLKVEGQLAMMPAAALEEAMASAAHRLGNLMRPRK